MSTSTVATAAIAGINRLNDDNSLANSQRHKASVLIEPPATTIGVGPSPTVDLLDDYAPSVPLRQNLAPQSISADTLNLQQVYAPASVEPPVVWTTGCSQNPTADPKPAVVSLDFTLPTHLTPQPASIGSLANVLPYEPTKIETETTEKSTTENPQTPTDSATPKPDEDPNDTPTPKPVTNSEAIAIPISLGYSSTFSGAPTRTTGTSPPNGAYGKESNDLSYSQVASGRAFSESSHIENSTILPYAGPSYATVTSSVAAYATPVASSLSYASAN